MPQFTNPPSMITERRSWNPTEADEPETRPEKPGTPTTDRSGLPDGLAFIEGDANLDRGFLDPPSTDTPGTRPNLVRSLNPHLNASC